jgi:CubicO group peptidase (beta-lactamase class C family)
MARGRAHRVGSRATSADLDAFVRRLVRAGRVPGLAVALARAGRPTLLRGYGWRDREARLPITGDTVFGIASMTKSFTAVAILALQEDGRLRVTDPVVRHLPEFRTPDARTSSRVRLHHLLTHSSGLPPLPSIYYEMLRSERADPTSDFRELRRVGFDTEREPIERYDDLLEYLAHERYRVLGAPGEFFSYSNEGFGLLGAIVERVSGRSYESFVEDRILRPSGMRRTTFDSGVMFRQPEVATLYTSVKRGRGTRVVRSPLWHEMSCLRATGGLRSTLSDLLRYLEIFRTDGRAGRERILSAASVRAMLSPHVPASPGRFYGYGLYVVPDFPGGRVIYHSGGLKGVSSIFAVLPEAGITGAALSNLDGAPSHLALTAAIDRELGLRLTTPFVRYVRRREPPRNLRRYAGEYRSGEGIWLRVRPGRRDLRVDFTGIEITNRNKRAVPVGPDSFVFGRRGDEFYLRFFSEGPRAAPYAVQAGSRVVRRRSPAEIARAKARGWTW